MLSGLLCLSEPCLSDTAESESTDLSSNKADVNSSVLSD